MVLFAAAIADKRGHVFNQPEQRHIHPLEHINTLAGIHQGDVLGRRDDNRSCNKELLAQGHLDIARARRQIHQQHIQPSPFHLVHHLLQGAHQHRPAPDDGFVFRGHQAQGHQRYAVVSQRQDGASIRAGRPTGNPQHAGLARAVDVGVQQADLETFRGQGNRQVGRHGGFANATLARGDGDDPINAPGVFVLRLGSVGSDQVRFFSYFGVLNHDVSCCF